MGKREDIKRASKNTIEERLSELADLQAELSAQGEALKPELVMERYQISRRQALRYIKRLKEDVPHTLDPTLGPVLAELFLESLPVVNDVLRSDLEALNGMSGQSESEHIALIKARREQALAIARLGGQFLKELRDLGLLDQLSKQSREDVQQERVSSGGSGEVTVEQVMEAAQQELIDFERDLELRGDSQ